MHTQMFADIQMEGWRQVSLSESQRPSLCRKTDRDSSSHRQNTKDVFTLAQLISAYSLVDTDKAKAYPPTCAPDFRRIFCLVVFTVPKQTGSCRRLRFVGQDP